MSDILAKLEQTIKKRRKIGGADSYVAALTAKGRAKMAEKIGEEATEAVIAAVQNDRAAMIGESADLLFHLMVVLTDMDISVQDVLAELERREGVSGLDEKASRMS